MRQQGLWGVGSKNRGHIQGRRGKGGKGRGEGMREKREEATGSAGG